MKDHSISVYQTRYDISIVNKYLDTDTVKKSTKFYKTTLPSDMIFTKYDVYTSDDQVEKLSRELNIHYRAFIGSLIYLLPTRVDFSFVVHKLANFLFNPGKEHVEGLIQLLRYIRYNRHLALKYHADIKYPFLFGLLRQDIINTEDKLIVFSDSSCNIVHILAEV